MDNLWLELILIGVGIVANGVFAGSEIALVSARISRLAEMRGRSVRGAGTAMQLKETPDAFLATIQIAITAVGTLASVVGGATAVERLSPWLVRLGLGGAAETVALGIVVVVMSFLSLVVGELAPKAIALRDPERTACRVAPLISALSRMSSAVVRLLTASTGLVLKVLGMGTTRESPFVSEEDVRYLVREGARKGIFDPAEETLVHNVFEFADTIVREIMTPRLQIEAIDVNTPAADVLAAVVRIGHSRVPVYEGSLETIVGTVTLKDLLRAVASGDALVLRSLARPALFVPETARIGNLLQQLQQTRQEVAVVVDEYGAIVGLVTVEDVVAEIVGEFPDRTHEAAELVRLLPDGSAIVDGLAPVDDVERALAITLPESRDYATVAGLLLATLKTVPARGTSVTLGGRRWTILDMDGPRIRTIRVGPADGRASGRA